jgi:hypothetical protein
MPTLSRKTVGIAIRIMERWPRTMTEHFLFENGVPDDFISGSSKLDLLLGVFRSLERTKSQQMSLQLIEAALLKLQDSSRAELEQALFRDGFTTVGGRVVDAEPELADNRTAVEALLDRYPSDFDLPTLKHHWEETVDLFRQERWDSSVAHCRNFVEQLLLDIARSIATDRSETPDLPRPVRVRDYLEEVGFFDHAERERLVNGVYGYFSEQGSHPGISTQSAARVSNSILASFALYVLEKHDAWRRGELSLS